MSALSTARVLAVAASAVGALVFGQAFAATPQEQVSLSRMMPELAAALPLGPTAQGVWSGAVDRDAAGRGRFLLNNSSNETSIYYGYRLRSPDAEDDMSVEVSLPRSGITKLSGAGLLFDFRPAGPDYCAFILHPDGVAGIYARDRDGFHPLAQARATDFRHGTGNRLTLRRHGDRLTAFVNGREVLQLADLGPSCPRAAETGTETGIGTETETGTGTGTGTEAAGGQEGSGIIALSVGRFGFRNFDLR